MENCNYVYIFTPDGKKIIVSEILQKPVLYDRNCYFM